MRRAIEILLGGSFEAFPRTEVDVFGLNCEVFIHNQEVYKPTEYSRSLFSIPKRFDITSEAIRQTQKDSMTSLSNVVSTQRSRLTGQRYTDYIRNSMTGQNHDIDGRKEAA